MLFLGNWSGALEKLLQESESIPSASSESSDFQHFQPTQWCAIFLMKTPQHFFTHPDINIMASQTKAPTFSKDMSEKSKKSL